MDSSQRIEPSRASELLRAWFATRNTRSVDFREVLDPEVDPDGSYSVAYEASFVPEELDRARAEVWVTHDGLVAIGFEEMARVGRRLGKPVRSVRFAAGTEPVEMSEQQLTAVLELVADGRIGLRVVMLPLLGMASIRAIVAIGTKDRHGLPGSSWRWLRERSAAAPRLGRLLEFRGW